MIDPNTLKIIGSAIAAAITYMVADRFVEKKTGKTIPQHVCALWKKLRDKIPELFADIRSWLINQRRTNPGYKYAYKSIILVTRPINGLMSKIEAFAELKDGSKVDMKIKREKETLLLPPEMRARAEDARQNVLLLENMEALLQDEC